MLTNVGWSLWLGFLGLIGLAGGISIRGQDCGLFGSPLICSLGGLVEIVGADSLSASIATGVWAFFDWR